MNKYIITIISIFVVIGAIFTAIIIFNPKQEDMPIIEEKIAEEEILDDCTDEYEVMQEETAKANSEEVKTSPNCSLTIKTYYKKCGHTTSEYKNLPQELVNLTKEQIQEKYPDYTIENFENNQVALYQEKDSECNEHYIVKDKEGMLTIYQLLEDGNQKEIETTGVSIEFLPEADKANVKDGIRVNGKQNLNQLIEDFE